MRPLRAGLYARVSTADQQTLPLQITTTREYAEHRGWTVAVVAEGIGSGAKVCPKHQELMKKAKRGQIDVVVVWKLDR
jgi:putative DNA-invertase from lambdoid prophage Rac